jgi:hypothetical protein
LENDRFPGARYDYRDWIDKHNERIPLPLLSLGRPAARCLIAALPGLL